MTGRLYLLSATFARMLVGMVTYIILARYLGPAQFGSLAAMIAICTLASVVSDYGMNTYFLRLISQNPERSGGLISNALQTKIILSSIVGIPFFVVASCYPSFSSPAIFVCILIGCFLYSCGELLLVVPRSRGAFGQEAKVVVLSSIIMLGTLGSVAILTRSALACALAFTISRAVYFAAAYLATATTRSNLLLDFWGSFGGFRDTLLKSKSYALDNILTVVSGQLDILVYGTAFAAHSLGIYQGGSRIVQVIVPVASVFATFYLPRLSIAAGKSDLVGFTQLARRVIWEFLALSVVGSVALLIAGAKITDILYGPLFEPLKPLWPGFAAFAALRFLSAAYGIQLVALGEIAPRIFAQILSSATFIALFLLIRPDQDLVWSSWILAASTVPGMLLLAFHVWKKNRTSAVWISVGVMILMIGFFPLVGGL